jgi:hypothetical protein
MTRVCRGGWKTDRGIADPSEVHVRPRDDLMWHPLDMHCVCGPRVEHRPPGWVVIHHSLDGRETTE